ncbi:hypothetical protein H2201_003978 [Coniosporium apollinis]|uniref:Pyridoxamine 5'-phosphate oxidase N-terminal domain-containing protein n=1 Tax=Coniosporium apollinis TaxID=61459 RepID=A0ABQ9NX27_9PEZI|nr:hypothetical protein H2201_003978 [Coniosporium apollinis]
MSNGSFHPPPSITLPDEVVACLQNARFLHLATSHHNVPHISLMNYTYLPQTPYHPHPIIIMTTPPPTSSQKTANLLNNPRVSLLVHDWVSHRPPTLSQEGRAPSPTRGTAERSSLASLLMGINTAALSRISATINGTARLVEAGSDEETWLKKQHLENNTFCDSAFSSSPEQAGGLWLGQHRQGQGQLEDEDGDGGRGTYIEGQEVRVVVVRIRDGRVADWKGGVRDWCLVGGEEEDGGMVNGT